MTKTVNDAWQQAVRDINIERMKELLDDDPALVDEGIVHARRNGTTYKKSPLRMVNRSIDAARLLVTAGADPNDGADSVLAIHGASLEVAAFLLDSGADVNRIGYEQGTALMFEVGQRNPDTARLLVERGAYVNVQRAMDGNSAMHFAVLKGYPEMVDILLAGGANPALNNNDGHTPIDIARTNDVTEIINKLEAMAG